MAAAAPSAAPLLPAAAFQLGFISAQQLALYNSLPNALLAICGPPRARRA